MCGEPLTTDGPWAMPTTTNVNGLDENFIALNWLQSSKVQVFNGTTQIGSDSI